MKVRLREIEFKVHEGQTNLDDFEYTDIWADNEGKQTLAGITFNFERLPAIGEEVQIEFEDGYLYGTVHSIGTMVDFKARESYVLITLREMCS